jgi:hypothetical protein
MSEPVPGLPGSELVFRRPRSSRKHLLTRAVTALVFAGIVAAAEKAMQPHMIVIFAYLIGLVAVGNAAAYALGGRSRTVLTSEGIEVRRYVRRVIPWSEVRAFRVRGPDLPGLLSPDPGSARQIEPRIRESITDLDLGDLALNFPMRTPRRVTVEVVRTNGRPVVLPAPIVAGPQGDSEFGHKVRQIEQWRQYWASGQSAPQA